MYGSPGSASARGIGPQNQQQAGCEAVLENTRCGCGHRSTQAAREPRALAGTELTSTAVLAGTQRVVARIKLFRLQLQDGALNCREELQVGWERQARAVRGGITASCCLPGESHCLKSSKKGRARYVV